MQPQERSADSQIRAPRLAGRYVVTRLLGKGAHARVYLAHDSRLKQWRAVKVLASNYIDDDHVRSRFEAEAEVMAKLSHQNLMRVIDIDRDGKVPFMVMELARGGAVLDWCKRRGALPPRLALRVAMQCAEGLHHAHEQGVVHRDVKPHNILIREEGRVVLTDFGIARIEDGQHLTAAGSAMGTFVFMAPEQRTDAKSVDRRADVYGLGATLFTVLTLRTSAELFFAEARDDLLAGVPEALRPMILAACRYEPDQRYPTMLAFRDAMGELLASLAPTPEPELFEDVIRPPAEPPQRVGREANVDDLVALVGSPEPSSATPAPVPARSTGLTLPPAERSFEETPTVLPYRMPERAGPAYAQASESLPDYIDQSTLPPPRPAIVAPLPPSIELQPAEVIGASPGQVPLVLEVVQEPAPSYRLAYAVVVACLLLVMALFGLGISEKTRASEARKAATQDLLRTVDTHDTLADELARAGADAEQLKTLYFGFEDAQGPAKVEAAVSFVEAAVTAGQRHPMSGLAQTQVEQLSSSLRVYREAQEKWKKAKASRLGRLSGEIGLY